MRLVFINECVLSAKDLRYSADNDAYLSIVISCYVETIRQLHFGILPT